MIRKSALILFALFALTLGSTSARAQFGPAIGPPAGPVPTTPSRFPPLTIPPAPPGWMGTTPNPMTPAQHHVYRVYYRVSLTAPWKYYASYDEQSDAIFAVDNLRAAGYGSFYN